MFGPKLFFLIQNGMFLIQNMLFWSKMGFFWSKMGFVGPKFVFLVQNVFFYENVENVSIPDSDRGRLFTPFRVRDLTKNL